MINNKEIRFALRLHDVKQWQVAEALGMAEATFSRKLRHEMPEETKEKIIRIIEELGEKK